VSFGREWLRGSVVDCSRRTSRGSAPSWAPTLERTRVAALDAGRVPELKALRLHNGTIYRWNRACYGISENGKPHLRIELRVLPSGPTIATRSRTARSGSG
jgi:hypothetical protein